VYGNKGCLFWYPYKTQKWEEEKFWIAKLVVACSNQ
jgi:hypothetical protein